MGKLSFRVLFLIILIAFSCRQNNNVKRSDAMEEKTAKSDTVVKMESNSIILLVNLKGGAYFDFHLKEIPLNPISWRGSKPGELIFMGHFLCFDRWGPPSAGDKANGFIHHGEVNTVPWELLTTPQIIEGRPTCSMMCKLPMAGLQLTRKIELSADEPVYFVTEQITNLNKNGRIFNIVQHVSIAPPFLDKSTLFDNNTLQGFEDRNDGSPDQDEVILKWPMTDHNGAKVNLRQFEVPWPEVSSFMFGQNEEYGWVTACNREKNIMLGYIWLTKDYPWINFWRSMANGIPTAYGMEFGTTGLHEPLPVVAKKGKIFDRNLYAYIDANEIIIKSFTAFLSKIPQDYNGVEKIEVSNSTFTIKEKTRPSRDITYHLK
jgi:hypothetical protein